MEIKYNGKAGDVVDLEGFGFKSKGELFEVPDHIGERLLKTGLYVAKGAKVNVPDPAAVPIEEAEQPTPPPGAPIEVEPKKKSKK